MSDGQRDSQEGIRTSVPKPAPGCELCGRPLPAIRHPAQKLHDGCWELETRVRQEPELALKVLADEAAAALARKPVVPAHCVSVCGLHNQEYIDGCPECAKVGARALAVRPAPVAQTGMREALEQIVGLLTARVRQEVATHHHLRPADYAERVRMIAEHALAASRTQPVQGASEEALTDADRELLVNIACVLVPLADKRPMDDTASIAISRMPKYWQKLVREALLTPASAPSNDAGDTANRQLWGDEPNHPLPSTEEIGNQLRRAAQGEETP